MRLQQLITILWALCLFASHAPTQATAQATAQSDGRNTQFNSGNPPQFNQGNSPKSNGGIVVGPGSNQHVPGNYRQQGYPQFNHPQTNGSSTVRFASPPPTDSGGQTIQGQPQNGMNRQRNHGAVSHASYEEPASFDGDQFFDQQVGDPLAADQQQKEIPLDNKDPLAKPLTPPKDSGAGAFSGFSAMSMKPLMTTGLSLGLVLALFCAIVWLSKKSGGKANRALPNEIVEVLGVTAITPKQQMQLVRLGNKILLLSMTQQGVQPIGEVTDPEEVARICAVCQSNRPNSMSNTFRQVLNQLENERTSSGFLGSQSQTQAQPTQQQTTQQPSQPQPTGQYHTGRTIFEA